MLAVLIVLWLAWLSGSMRLGALASVDRWRQVTVSPFEGPLEAGGGGSSDPPAGLEGGFRRRPHSVRAGSARIDRVGLAQARRRVSAQGRQLPPNCRQHYFLNLGIAWCLLWAGTPAYT